MKYKFLITLLLFVYAWHGFCQRVSQKIGTNSTIITPSAALEIESTTKGLLPPRMTFAQRNAIVTPSTGLMVYCTNCGLYGELQFFNGASWVNIIGGAAAMVSPSPRNAIGTGTFSGKTCFDIALGNNDINSCGALTSRSLERSNFTQMATHTQSYTFTPSGTVSNVRFEFVNTNGNVITAISGDNTGNNISTDVVATVNYNTNLNTLASGLSKNNSLTADIYVVYNDGATNNGADKQLKLTVNVKDCACCGAPTNTGGFLVFKCHNLGADESADPFTPSWKLNGAYFQWGKKPVDTNGDGYRTKTNNGPEGFVAAPTGPEEGQANVGIVASWSTSAAANGSWNVAEATPVKTANDPCPSGYRVPTRNEWVSVYSTTPINTQSNWSNVGTFSSIATNYSTGKIINNTLYLPNSGYRISSNGRLTGRNVNSNYWSSSLQDSSFAHIISIQSNVFVVSLNSLTSACSVRCVAE